MLRTIIIDDEPLAIESLSIILKKHCHQDVQVIASSNSPSIGKSLIDKHNPDLVFTDVEMPGMSGIDLMKSFEDPKFHVVFVTAFDAYAIEALRLSAIDYLLKPVETEEILRVIEKIKNQARKNENSFGSQLQNLEKILSQASSSKEPKIGIGMAEKIVFISVGDILYCKAEGPYTHVYTSDGKKIVASKSLGEFEQQLSNHHFFRIHHSILVNLSYVKEFQRFNGGYVIMENNAKLEVSHRKRNDFMNAVNDFTL